MSLVAAICTQCGAQIEVDNTQEAGICKYCRTAFIVEKAINNYNTTHVVNNYGTMISNLSYDADQLFESCMKLFEAGLYNDMYNKVEQFKKDFPTDYRIYYLLFKWDIRNTTPIVFMQGMSSVSPKLYYYLKGINSMQCDINPYSTEISSFITACERIAYTRKMTRRMESEIYDQEFRKVRGKMIAVVVVGVVFLVIMIVIAILIGNYYSY